ncbi:P-loop NTPase family protein [Lentilactobacillus buchneri]|uniref:hypothetical protein n=1 Tax=Lentilactobacillus buchneri TaxID=1581 RepID=UPI001CDBA125|nr:hypothetical protein [Lentilactobacillus buchneri]
MNQLDSMMKSFADKLFETYGTRCPNCGELLLRPKVLNKVTGKKMHGACFNCGYKEPLPTHTTPTNEKLSEQARKDATLKYFNAYSIYSSFEVFNHRFDNYTASTSAQKLVKQRCQKLANQIAEEQTIHTMLLGNTGVGKTHLAVAMMYRIFELTHYRQHGMFIDWRQLVADKKLVSPNRICSEKLIIVCTICKLQILSLLTIWGANGLLTFHWIWLTNSGVTGKIYQQLSLRI